MIRNDDPAYAAALARRLAREKRMWNRHRFRPVDDDLVRCVMTVLGEPCTEWEDAAGLCFCVRHRSCLDHRQLWRDEQGCLVLTGEPYGVDGEEILDLVMDAKQRGLRVTMDGDSAYYPGKSLLILIELERS